MQWIRRGSAIVVAVAAALAPAGSAHAALTPQRAQTIADDLGARSAGTYFDAARGAMVVTVLDRASAREVRAAGGVARLVGRSEAQLERIVAEIDVAASLPGSAYGIDTVENKVVVTVDDTVDAAQLARLQAVLADDGDAARIERISGRIRTFISGGQSILGGGYRCSLGFNVNRSGVAHFLTAGHCGEVVRVWTTPPATTVAYSFPGDDFALARYTSTTSRPGNVYLYNGTYQDIVSAANPFIGQSVRRSGSTTRLRSGTVTALNQTVNYGGGDIVRGLARTNACAEPGDSGGPFFASTVALGLTSGGSGNCSVGGTTFFQPVVEALGRYGARVY